SKGARAERDHRAVTVLAVATYRPAWTDGAGDRVAGRDEDVLTMAVAAGRAALAGAAAERVVIVSRQAGELPATAGPILEWALGLDGVVVEQRKGGAAAAAEVLVDARQLTLL